MPAQDRRYGPSPARAGPLYPQSCHRSAGLQAQMQAQGLEREDSCCLEGIGYSCARADIAQR
jgi:hypothetical protein